MNARELSTSNIRDSLTLGDTVSMLYQFVKDLTSSQFKDTDAVNHIVENNFSNDIANMNASEKWIIINKMHMVLIYLQSKQNQLDELMPTKDYSWEDKHEIEQDYLFMQQIAQAIKVQCIGSIINDHYEYNKLENDLEKTHASFKKKTESESLKQQDINNIYYYIKNNKEKVYTQPFTLAREKLNTILKKTSKVSGLMHYIYGEDNRGFVKTKEGLEVASLQKRLDDIENGKESEKEKLIKMEQAVLDIYWHVRQNRGVLPSQLGNALEGFLKNELELEKKYGYLAKVPHDVRGMAREAFQLNKIKKVQGHSIEKELEQLYVLLSRDHLKTNRKNSITELKIEIDLIVSNENLSENEKENKMKLAICKKYMTVQNSANHRWFFHQSNLADALKEYMKQVYGMDVAKIKKYIENNESKNIELNNMANLK